MNTFLKIKFIVFTVAIIFISIFIIYVPCAKSIEAGNELPKSFLITDFKKWDLDKQIDFINSLKINAKFKFLEMFLPDSEFSYLPNTMCKFLGTGELLINEYNLRLKKPYVNHWKIVDNCLFLFKDKSNLGPPQLPKEKWIDFQAKKHSGEDVSLWLMFKTDRSNKYIKGLIYEKYGFNNVLFYLYEKNLKDKK